MAQPEHPVIPGHISQPGDNFDVAVYNSTDPDVQPLPALKFYDRERHVLTRWHLSPEERLRVAVDGDIYLWQQTHGRPLQPQRISIERPRFEGEAPPSETQPPSWADSVVTNARVRLGWRDRLRVLLGCAVRLSVTLRTQAPVGATEARCDYLVDEVGFEPIVDPTELEARATR